MAEGRQPGSWLEDEDPFAQTTAKKKEVVDEALLFAQKYLIFESGVAKDLLDFWTRTVRSRKIAPTASLGELAYYNGVREFIEGLHQQIEFAHNGGQSPYQER